MKRLLIAPFPIILLSQCGGGSSGASGTSQTPGQIFSVPSTIDGTGTTDVTDALNTWIETVPDGTAANPSIIKFPSGATYLLSEGIQFRGRSYLVFDGYGAKLKLNPSWDDPSKFPSQHQSLFLLGWKYKGSSGLTNKNIVIKGFECEATNPNFGVYDSKREAAHAVEIDSSDGVEVYDVSAHGIYGDGFKTTDGKNLHIHNNYVKNAGRQGISIISGDHIVIENNQFDDVGYYVLDIEPYANTQSATDIVFRNNTAGSWGPSNGHGAGFVACGCGEAYNQIGNITITGNTFTGTVDASLNSYFNLNQYKRFFNIVFTNNKASQVMVGPAMVFKSVDGLTITGNTQPLSSGVLYTITGCTSVTSTPNP